MKKRKKIGANPRRGVENDPCPVICPLCDEAGGGYICRMEDSFPFPVFPSSSVDGSNHVMFVTPPKKAAEMTLYLSRSHHRR